MLSFNDYLEEKKSAVKVNPRKEDLYEKDCGCDDKPSKSVCKGCMGSGQKGGEECTHCEGKGYHMDEGAPEGVSEAKKKDDSYLETDFKKRQKNNEKARKDMEKMGTSMKNPHFESTNQEEHAYVSTEESAEEVQKGDISEDALNVLKDILVETAFDLYTEARRGPAAPGKEERAAKAKASLAAVKKRQSVLDAHEKKTGKKLDISKSPEGKAHAKNFPGSRQDKKVKGKKETDLETHNRRTNRNVERIVKKGYTSKEKKEVQSMAKHASRYD
jgi:hypothetical protein